MGHFTFFKGGFPQNALHFVGANALSFFECGILLSLKAGSRKMLCILWVLMPYLFSDGAFHSLFRIENVK